MDPDRIIDSIGIGFPWNGVMGPQEIGYLIGIAMSEKLSQHEWKYLHMNEQFK